MKRNPTGQKQIALSLEITEGFKRHRDIYAGCQRYAYEQAWKVRIEPAVERDLESGRLTNCDGIIARAPPEIQQAAERFGIPLVNVWMMSKAKDLPSVFHDCPTAGRLVAEHFLSRGMQRFGFIGFRRFEGQKQLLKGYKDCLRASGYRVSSYLVPPQSVHGTYPVWENFFDGVTAWLEKLAPPFAIWVGSDIVARTVMGLCEMKGLRIPEDVVIAGYGNEPTVCDLSPPTLTSLDANGERIGYEAAALLDRLMAGAPPPTAPILIPPKGVIARQTTDFYASDDELVARCLRLIADQLDQPLRVDELALELGVSRRGLERRFQKSIGQPIAVEITRLRVERVKRRLVRTKEPVKSIALECGFSGSNHLCAAFRRMTGQTPSAFRAKANDREADNLPY